MKTLIITTVLLLLVGCDERYRYPCQNPHNWDEQYCKKPFCSGNGTCPEDLSHYVKENEKNQIPQIQQKEIKGVCK